MICRDALRSLVRQPETADALRAEFAAARGGDRRLDAFASALEDDLARPDEAGARHLVERLALAFGASLLVRHAPEPVADAFCAARLGDNAGLAFGALPPGTAFEDVLARAWPA